MSSDRVKRLVLREVGNTGVTPLKKSSRYEVAVPRCDLKGFSQ